MTKEASSGIHFMLNAVSNRSAFSPTNIKMRPPSRTGRHSTYTPSLPAPPGSHGRGRGELIGLMCEMCLMRLMRLMCDTHPAGVSAAGVAAPPHSGHLPGVARVIAAGRAGRGS